MIRSISGRAKSAPRDAFWDQPLGYAHAWATIMMALALGLAFHQYIGYRLIPLVPSAVLGLVTLTPLVALAVWARLHPGQPLVKWMTGIPFAMSSTAAVVLLAIVGGVIPGRIIAERFGVTSVWESWPFLFVGYLMLANIVGSSGRRAWPLTYTNVVYLLSHLGLAVALIGGAMSAIMMERNTMVLFRGMPNQTLTNRQMKESRAPVEVTLREFTMESFSPTLTLAVLDEKAKDGMRQVPGTAFLKKGAQETVAGLKVEVLRHYKHAAFDGLHWREIPWKTAAPASEIRVTLRDGTTKTGWISCGSQETMPSYLQISDRQAFLMNTPRPKKFESEIAIDGKTHRVGVNQPIQVKGFTVYQFSYDEKMGAASPYSVLEWVRDPGLPVVYTGIFALLLGTLLHLWNGVGGKK